MFPILEIRDVFFSGLLIVIHLCLILLTYLFTILTYEKVIGLYLKKKPKELIMKIYKVVITTCLLQDHKLYAKFVKIEKNLKVYTQ